LGLTAPHATVVCDATTATWPCRGASLVARAPIPCVLPSFVISPPGAWLGRSAHPTPGLLGTRSPLPGLSPGARWLSHVPAFPLDRQAPLSDPGVVSWALAMTRPRLRPARAWNPSAATHVPLFGAPYRGLPARYPRLRPAPCGEARGCAPDRLARTLVRWDVSLTDSHPLGSDNPFPGFSPHPKVAGLPWRDQALVRRGNGQGVRLPCLPDGTGVPTTI
jgi:hypothetical protein